MTTFVLYNFCLFLSALLGFSRKLQRPALWGAGIINLIIVTLLWQESGTTKWLLKSGFGVELVIDELSRLFLLTLAVVWFAVAISLENKKQDGFFVFLLLLFLGAGNLLFISNDLFNLYVLLELLTILVFLLAGKTGETKPLWSGMKYLLLVASAMNLYLLGVGMVFLAEGNFGISSITITGVPAGFLIAGLLGKTGLFLFSMWLVDLHSSVSSEISALLSGIAVKTGLYALLRLRPALGNHFEVVPFFAVISAILGVIFAFHEEHYKRILAYSTLSQIGYILIAPETGIFYVFAHGIFKSWLFLGADLLPNYDTGVPSRYRLPIFTWSLVALPALSIAGFPWTVGGSSKEMLIMGTTWWQQPILYAVSVGTAAVFAPFFFSLPKLEWGEIPKNFLGHVLLAFFAFFPLFGWGKKAFESIGILFLGVFVALFAARYRKPLPRILERLENATLLYLILFILCVVMSIYG
jgi:multicomponent Na+:H+ antiporter subunit D